MGEQDGVGNNVSESDNLVIFDDSAHDLIIGKRDDLPVVVSIGVWVSGDLLTLT